MKELIPDSFFKKIILIITFFTITPLTLFSTTLSLVYLSSSAFQNSNENKISTQNLQESSLIYSPLVDNFPAIGIEITKEDARSELIKKFTQKYNSPLMNYSAFIVEMADKYNVDWRLTTAIAMKESGGCRVIPEGSFNCWGWGIHSQGTLKFKSFEEGIEKVTKGLKEEYFDKGYKTLEEIMGKYANPNSTTWAQDVSFYMSQIQ